MIKNSMKFRLEWQRETWYLIDPDNDKVRIPFDQAVVDVAEPLRAGDTGVTGTVIAIHGLPADIANHLTADVLRALGVGVFLSCKAAPPKHPTRRAYLQPQGFIDFQTQQEDSRYERFDRLAA